MSTLVPEAASASPMPEGVTDLNYHPAPGYLGNLTVVQLHTLEKLKKELKEEGKFVEERMDDATLLRYFLLFLYPLCRTCSLARVLLSNRGTPPRSFVFRPTAYLTTLICNVSRFLRARKFDLAKAKEMLLNAEQWRKDFKVDDVVKNLDFKEKEEVNKYYPQYYHKTDKVHFIF